MARLLAAASLALLLAGCMGGGGEGERPAASLFILGHERLLRDCPGHPDLDQCDIIQAVVQSHTARDDLVPVDDGWEIRYGNGYTARPVAPPCDGRAVEPFEAIECTLVVDPLNPDKGEIYELKEVRAFLKGPTQEARIGASV